MTTTLSAPAAADLDSPESFALMMKLTTARVIAGRSGAQEAAQLLTLLLDEYRGEELAYALDAEGFTSSLAEAGKAVHLLGLGLSD